MEGPMRPMRMGTMQEAGTSTAMLTKSIAAVKTAGRALAAVWNGMWRMGPIVSTPIRNRW